MSKRARDGRAFRAERAAIAASTDDGRVEVLAPAPGTWRGGPGVGALVRPGDPLGELEQLGVLVLLRAPAGAHGVVVQVGGEAGASRSALDHGAMMVLLDPSAAVGAGDASDEELDDESVAGLVLRAPSSGRFYARPAPDQDAFVVAGDEISTGQTVALLEVMKTFNRVQYGGEGFPDRARVLRVVPEDECDLEADDPILELESAD